MPGCLLGFFCESDDLTVRLRPLFAICSEIPVQFIAFLNKLFQLDIHPVDLSFVDSFDGDGLSLGAFNEVTEGLQIFVQGSNR